MDDSRCPSEMTPVSLIFFRVPPPSCARAGEAAAVEATRATTRRMRMEVPPGARRVPSRCVTTEPKSAHHHAEDARRAHRAFRGPLRLARRTIGEEQRRLV